MKNLVTLAIIMLKILEVSNAQWREICSFSDNTYNIYFPSEDIGYAESIRRGESPHFEDYYLSKTSNGSKSFGSIYTERLFEDCYGYRNYKFLSERIGFRENWSCNSFNIEYTFDYGGNWQNLFSFVPETSGAYCMDYIFTNDTLGYILLIEPIIVNDEYIYINKMIQYTPSKVDTLLQSYDELYKHITFSNDSTGFLLANISFGNSSKWSVMGTHNYGLNWEILFSDSIHTFKSIQFLNEKIGFITTNENVLLKTSNSGKTWKSISISASEILNKFVFSNEMEGYAIGNNGYLLKSIDGGQNWVKQEIETENDLIDIAFPSDSIGYILTSGSKIYTTRSFTTSLPNIFGEMQIEYYPNPTRNLINIKIDSYMGSTIEIMNLNGKILKRLNPTSELIKIDLSGYETGMYLIKIESDYYSQIKKIFKY